MSLVQLAKTWTKGLLAFVLYYSGVLWILAWRRLHGKAVVLMYHRVLPVAERQRSFSHPGIIVTPETFRKHLEFLQRHFHPIPLAAFISHLESKQPFPKRACLITFDDGWVDNHDYALPLLHERSIPAVVFVATGYVDSDQTFWQEQLGHLLYQVARHRIDKSILQKYGIDLGRAENEKRIRREIAAVVDRYRGEPYDTIAALTSELSEALIGAGHADALTPVDRFMTWAQLTELAASGIAVASHTSSHRYLTRLDQPVIHSELTDSRAELKTQLGLDTMAVAYPGGRYNETARRSALDIGYRVGFTTENAPAGPGDDPLLIPRINVHESACRTVPLFLSRIIGLH
jgi:peptidoglycan/xylan/chitin deacetylase (PgdA/CDA1 family)